jgi:hypothetical protein
MMTRRGVTTNNLTTCIKDGRDAEAVISAYFGDEDDLRSGVHRILR